MRNIIYLANNKEETKWTKVITQEAFDNGAILLSEN